MNEDIKNNFRLAWYAFLQVLYSFPPLQRVILVAGVLLLIPGYWVTRITAKTYYNWTYSKQLVAAHPSFSNPRSVVVSDTKIFPLKSRQYVAYAKITNSNLDLAAFDVPYTITIRSTQGAVVYTTVGHTYILPGQDQYVTTQGFSATDEPARVEIVFGTVHWQNRLQIPDVKLGTPAVGFSDATNGLQIDGTVVNNSPYALSSVRLTFLIYDTKGLLVGVVQRDEFDVASRSRRSFPQIWPAPLFAGNISKIVPVASTNVLDIRNLQSGANALQGTTP